MGFIKIAWSLFAIGMVCISAGAGTFSYLSDVETSEANTFTAGTLDLKIKDQDEFYYGDGVTATWTMSNMKPGDSVNGWVRLRKDGSIKADKLDIDVVNTVIDPEGPESDSEEGTTDLDKEMVIIEMKYYSKPGIAEINCLELLEDKNKNGYVDLDDLETQGIDGLKAPTHTTTKDLNMTLQFDPFAGNYFQGDILNLTMTFTLH